MNPHPSVESIRQRIAAAVARAGRSTDDVTLIAVSKQKPLHDIETAYAAGVRHFGENRTAELENKARQLAALDGIVWHYIGNLQSTHSRIVAQYAHCFHAVDRVRIAARLSHQLQGFNRELDVFVQVNVSGEESKGGFECADWQQHPARVEALANAMREIAALPRINVQGLMTMAPFTASETEYRTIFESMKHLSHALHQQIPELDAHALSMGMSGDFEIAIENGASHVRIGSALFGRR